MGCIYPYSVQYAVLLLHTPLQCIAVYCIVLDEYTHLAVPVGDEESVFQQFHSDRPTPPVPDRGSVHHSRGHLVRNCQVQRRGVGVLGRGGRRGVSRQNLDGGDSYDVWVQVLQQHGVVP